MAVGGSKDRQQAAMATDVLNPTISSLPKPAAPLTKSVAPIAKPVTSMTKPVMPSSTLSDSLSEASKSNHATARSSSSQVIYEDDPCVICHDEMSNTTRNVSLDCGHKFHHEVSLIKCIFYTGKLPPLCFLIEVDVVLDYVFSA